MGQNIEQDHNLSENWLITYQIIQDIIIKISVIAFQIKMSQKQIKEDPLKRKTSNIRKYITYYQKDTTQYPLHVIFQEKVDHEEVLEQHNSNLQVKNKTGENQQKQTQGNQEKDLDLNQNIQNNHIYKKKNNYIQKQQKVQKTKKKKTKQKGKTQAPKQLILILIACFISIMTFIVSYLVYQLTPPVHLKKPISLKSNPIIIDRKFEVGKAYYQNYLITTESNTSIIEINYTMLVAVQETLRQETKFVSVLQKRSEKLFDQNGTFINETAFDGSDLYLKLLKEGKDAVSLPIDPSQNRTTFNLDNYTQQFRSNQPNTSFVPQKLVLPVFRFGLNSNGKITTFSFPSDLDKATLGLIRSFVKMFSPVLIKDLYVDEQTLQKVKKDNPMKRLLQFANQTLDNSTDESNQTNSSNDADDFNTEDSVYTEKEGFKFETDDETVNLYQQGATSYVGPTHNTQEQSSQSNTFTNDGQLKNSVVDSNTQFKSTYQPPSQQYSVMNFNLTQDSHQRAEMNLIESFKTSVEFIHQFQSLIMYYQQKNQNLNYTVEQLINYILGIIGPKIEGEPGQVRLLLEKDGSLTIISYDKQINILSTNVIGFQIGAYGYMELKISLYEDEKDPHKKIPKIIAGVGTILSLAVYKTKVPVLDYTKQLPPLTLKFTLQKIEGVVNLLKGNFIGKIISLSKTILNGDFQDNLVPNILNVLSMVEDVNKAVQAEQNANSPVSIIIKILSAVSDIRAIVDSKGMELLNPQNQFAKSLYGQLFSYFNVSFAEALQVFSAAKGSLQLIRNEGSGYLDTALRTFLGSEITEVERSIRSLIPQDVYQDYQRQIQKAKAIIEFLRFVRQNGLNYAGYVESSLISHQQNMVQLVKQVIDLYFLNQTNITDTFIDQVRRRYQTIESELKQFKDLKQFVNVTQMKNRVKRLFQSVLFPDILNGYFQQELSRRLNVLKVSSVGISDERTDCCQWKKKRRRVFFKKKICVFFNPANADQAAQRYYFETFKDTITPLFNSIVDQIANTLLYIKDVIEDQNIENVQKFFEIKPRIQQLQNMIPDSRIEDVLTKITEKLNGARKVLSKVGCGAPGHLYEYIANLGRLHQFVVSFRNRFNALKQTGLSVIQNFNDTIYTAIQQNAVVVQTVTDFFKTYKEYQDKTFQFFQKINYISKNYNPQKFAESSNIALEIFELYGTITNSLDELCQNKQDRKMSVDVIRQTYKVKLDSVANMTGGFFTQELNRLKNFLGNGSNSVYSKYLGTPFCLAKEQFQKDISTLFPDFDNFTIIFQLYSRMQIIRKYVGQQINFVRHEMRGLQRTFFKLFTPEGYRQFIQNTQSLAFRVENLVENISMELSYIREQAKVIYMFRMAAENQLTRCLQIFANSSFILSKAEMFPNLIPLTVQSFIVIQKLSFDVIAFVVASKEVLEYFQNSVENFKEGTQKILSSFKTLCTSFLNVSALVSQQYLNNLNRDFRNIILSLNDTIFPNISQNLNQIVSRFEGYNFSSPFLKDLFFNSMAKLNEFGVIIHNSKEKVFKQMQQFSDLAIKLIEKLQIGSLNSLYQLAEVIKTQFNNFFSSFPQMLKQLLQFKNFVDKDFRKIFTFGNFFTTVQKKVEQHYSSSIERIKSKVNQTEAYLSQNSKFYEKFQSSNAYASLKKASTEFAMDFKNVWNQANGQLLKIDEYLMEITGSVADILKQLNKAKEAVSSIKKSVQGRINNIKSHYQQIRKKFFNIQSLFFITLKGDLSETVMDMLRKITKQVDNIVEVDLVAVEELANSTLRGKVRLINQLIQKTKQGYDLLKRHRQVFFQKIEGGMNKIDEFIQDEIVSKFQKLKDGILYIKSKTDLQDPTRRIVLYQNVIRSKRAPIWSYTQAIPTVIGVFYVNLELNYTLGAKAFVALRQFRNIDLGVTFEASLVIQVSFSYGIAYILEFGFYLKGSILRASISPLFELNGIIPIQLMKAIADIDEISRENRASIQFAIDLQIHAVEVEVGFYLKHIWLQIIWIDIQLCFDFWFFSFCISFKLPIGFRIIFKRHDWGYKFPGIPILKKRILQLRIISWMYPK